MHVMDFIKDFIISILILVCIILVISLFSYNEISLSRVIPKSESYDLTSEMQKDLEDPNLEETQEVIVNYFIDGADLKGYEKQNKYVKGKSNPFTEYIPSNDIENENSSSIENDTNSSSGNFYEDDGTK